MNCPKCGSPITGNAPALCSACFQAALDEYAEFRRLFVDSSVAQAAKAIEEADDE